MYNMSKVTPRRFLLASSVWLATWGMIAISASEAEAARAKNPAPKGEPQKVSNSQLHHAIHELKHTKIELEKADHDYGGHRENAMKATSAAIHQLEKALAAGHKKRSTAKKSAKAPKGNQETQRVSDWHLGHAIRELQATKMLLAKANHDYGGHRADAIKAIDHAESQLVLALKFEKKK